MLAGAAALATRLAPLTDDGAWLYQSFLIEDGYLMLTVARNLALGKGLAVADGTTATNGVQPLATFVYALGSALVGASKAATVKMALVLQASLALGTSLVVARLARRVLGPSAVGRAAAVLAAVLWFCAPRNVSHTMNGLETALYCFVASLTLLAYESWRPRRASEAWGPRRSAQFGLLLGVLFLARNDAVFLIAALGFVHFATGTRASAGGRTADAAMFAAVAGLVGTPWMAYNWHHFGSIVPISGQSEMMGAGLGDNLPHLPLALWHQIAMVVPLPQFDRPAAAIWGYQSPLAAFACVGTLAILLRAWRRMTPAAQAFAGIGVAYGVGLGVYYGLFFGAHWFLTRFLFPLTLFATVGWAFLICRLAASATLALPRLAAAVPLGAAMIAALTVALGLQRHRQRGDHVVHRMHLWVERHVPSATWIASSQTGYLGYFHDRTINLDGKVNPRALAARRAGATQAYVEASGAELIVDWPVEIYKFLPGITSSFELAAVAPHPEFPHGGVLALKRRKHVDASRI